MSNIPKSSLTEEDFKRIARDSNVNDIWRAIADAAVAADRALHPKCNCGNPMELGVVPRVNGPCWVAQLKPEYTESDRENIIDRAADLDVIAAQQKGAES